MAVNVYRKWVHSKLKESFYQRDLFCHTLMVKSEVCDRSEHPVSYLKTPWTIDEGIGMAVAKDLLNFQEIVVVEEYFFAINEQFSIVPLLCRHKTGLISLC